MSDSRKPIKRALVSVYDKTGLEELAKGLHEAGVESSLPAPLLAVSLMPAFPSPPLTN